MDTETGTGDQWMKDFYPLGEDAQQMEDGQLTLEKQRIQDP